MAVSHVFSNAVADATGTVTVWYGLTTVSVAATDIVRPSDWNSAHNQYMTVTGNTVGQSTFSGTNIVIGGGPNITISGVNATRFDVSARAGSLNISAGTTSNNLTAVTFANANGLAFGLDGSTVTGSYTVPTVTNSSWTVSDNASSATVARLAFTNINGVTLSLSTGANGSHTIVGSHNALTSQSNQAVSAANGSYAFQTLSFSNANGISFGTSAGSAITASHNALTTARASNDAIGLNTAQSNVTWTVNSNGLSLDARGYAGTGTTFNGANVSGSMTVNSVGVQLSLSAAAAGGGETRLTAYAQSNTTQSSSGTIPLSSLNFAGAGIASVGITNGSVVVSVPAGGGAGDGGVFAGVSTGGNTAGSTGTVSTGNFVLVGSNGITLSQSTGAAGSAATVSIIGPEFNSRFWNGFGVQTANVAIGNSLVSIVPFTVGWPYVGSDLRVGASINVGTAANNSSAYIDVSVSAVLYSRNGATLSSILSASQSYTATWSSNATGSVTGIQAFTVTHAATTIRPGSDYFWAVHVSTTNTATGGAATTALGNTVSMIVLQSSATNPQMRAFGANTNNTQGAILGQGIISTGVTRASIALSDYTVTGSRGQVAGLFFEHRNQSVY